MRIVVIFLLATAIHVHSIKPYGMVAVRTCGSHPVWVAIYADERMTIPMANPFVANSDGSYEFHTAATCVDVREWRTK